MALALPVVTGVGTDTNMVNGHEQHWPWLWLFQVYHRRWNTDTDRELAYLVVVIDIHGLDECISMLAFALKL